MNITLKQATEIIKQGGVIIYPTDTAFGIGCRIDDPRAVDRLFAARRRPPAQATPILVSSVEMALAYYASPSDIVRRLMATYWPGQLTIVSPCHTELFYSPLRGGGQTVGLRMPNHEIPLTIIKEAGVPIVGTSANFHGGVTPYRLKDLDPQLVSLTDGVVAGECSVGMASTVVDCTHEPYRILRQGSVVLDPS